MRASGKTEDLVSHFLSSQPFPLDPFQQDAISHLAQGRSVLVSAPTGAGKTVVAEFAVLAALKFGKRCIYTTPLKALSNQKYRDLHTILGGRVGLLTGDVVINPSAPILIMTTEILRNMLQADPGRVEDVSHVILDEAHYIASEGRGTVWEETIVFLGKDTLVVALSATVSNADELAQWVTGVHRPMAVVRCDERPVPLEAHVALPGISRLLDDHGRLAVRSFGHGWRPHERRTRPGGKATLRGDRIDPVEVVRGLKLKAMLPAIYFVFSRQGCEEHTTELISADLNLTTKEEGVEIATAVEDAILQTPGLLGSRASCRWLDGLSCGVAPHHAGLLPPLKLLVEKLFGRGLIKVVFATETLAAGINMPARTVVMSSLIKRTDDGLRQLSVGEFQQMTGRAGRRGMDRVGFGVVVASDRYTPQEVAQLVKGPVEPLRSRFTLNYNMVANLCARYDRQAARKIVEQSFACFQGDALVAHLHQERAEATERLEALGVYCPLSPATARRELRQSFESLHARRLSLSKRLASLEGQLRHLARPVAVRLLDRLDAGSWLLIHQPGRTVVEAAILLSKSKTRGGDIAFAVITSLPAVVSLGTQHLVASLEEMAPVTCLPRAVIDQARSLGFLQHQRPVELLPEWSILLMDSGFDSASCEWPVTVPLEIKTARKRLDEVLCQEAKLPCKTCRDLEPCADAIAAQEALSYQVDNSTRRIEAVKSLHWREFETLARFLEEAGYLRGNQLLARGIAVANLRTTNELMSAECLAAGLLETADPVALASIVSCLVAEPPRGRQAWKFLPVGRAVKRVVSELGQLGRELDRLQRRHRVTQPLYLVTDYAGLTSAWAEGGQWSDVIAASSIDEGQLVRHLRQVIDLIGQFSEVPQVSDSFKAKTCQARDLLDRDIVKEVF